MTSQTKQCTTVQKNEFEQPCVLCLFFLLHKTCHCSSEFSCLGAMKLI